jgi:hypothetical protein
MSDIVKSFVYGAKIYFLSNKQSFQAFLFPQTRSSIMHKPRCSA